MIEEWRTVPGYPDYQVSNLGGTRTWRKPKNRHPRPKDPRPTCRDYPQGYPRIWMFSDEGKRRVFVHRLVLEVFVGPCPSGMEAAHKDGVRTNCALDNLSWKTHLSNEADKLRHGTVYGGAAHWTHTNPERRLTGDRNTSRARPENLARGDRNGARTKPHTRPRGERHGNAKFTNEQVREIRASAEPVKELAARYKADVSTIRDMRNGVTWSHL